MPCLKACVQCKYYQKYLVILLHYQTLLFDLFLHTDLHGFTEFKHAVYKIIRAISTCFQALAYRILGKNFFWLGT